MNARLSIASLPSPAATVSMPPPSPDATRQVEQALAGTPETRSRARDHDRAAAGELEYASWVPRHADAGEVEYASWIRRLRESRP